MMRFFVWSARVLVLFISTMVLPQNVVAEGFEVALSPSRFELSGNSSQRIGQSITLHNLAASEVVVAIRTLDWEYSPQGEIKYFDELRPGSCRPWLTLERRELKIPPRSKRNLRFQLDVPADAARGECRIMIAVEGVEPAYKALLQSGGASLSLPVSGRIAVPVYLAVNGAEPKLELLKVDTVDVKGKRTPVVEVVNKGDAHGRLEGSLASRDAKDVKFELAPEGTPIMPGQTRVLTLSPQAERGKTPPNVTLPIKGEGVLEWARGAFKIDAEFK